MAKIILEKLAEELQSIKSEGSKLNAVTKRYQPAMIRPTVIIRNEILYVSAEDGNYFADYYGEFRGGYPWIDPRLEAFAKRNGGYWEWENPGAIVLILN